MNTKAICRNCDNTGIAWCGGNCPCVKGQSLDNEITFLEHKYALNNSVIYTVSYGVADDAPMISVSHWGLHPC